jgi:hypothetical protein
MGIINKAVSTTFLNIIIRTNHGQTEIGMQYGGLWSSETCESTSCSNDSFASLTHITRWIKACVMLFYSCTMFPVDVDVYRVHPINVQLVPDPVIMPAKEEHRCNSGSEVLDKHEPRNILHCHVERRDQRFAVAERAER